MPGFARQKQERQATGKRLELGVQLQVVRRGVQQAPSSVSHRRHQPEHFGAARLHFEPRPEEKPVPLGEMGHQACGARRMPMKRPSRRRRLGSSWEALTYLPGGSGLAPNNNEG